MDGFLAVLKALSDETRLSIVKLLLTHDLCVGALAKHLGVSKPAVSQHLQVLRKADLVRGEKRGYFTHYSVNHALLRATAEELQALAAQQPKPRQSRQTAHQCCRKEENK